MAVSNQPIFPKTVISGIVKITPADTTTLKTLFTAGADGSSLENIIVTSTDTASKDLQFVITVSAVDYTLGTLTVPANSGFTAAVAVLSVFKHANFISALTIDTNNNTILRLPAGAILKVKALATLTAAKEISVICQGGDF
jgi:hypothetical protein